MDRTGINGLFVITFMFFIGCNIFQKEKGNNGPASQLQEIDYAFNSSECKKNAKTEHYGLLSKNPADYEGFKCIQWQQEPNGSLSINLFNFDTGCVSKWDGSVKEKSANKLHLEVISNPHCQIAACGTCTYDWSFTVKEFNSASDLELLLDVNSCSKSNAIESYKVVVPKDELSEGINCQYADFGAMMWFADVQNKCGTLNLPCKNISNNQCAIITDEKDVTSAVCSDDLLCSPIESGSKKRICMQSCESDADCSSDAMACVQGLCRIKSTFTGIEKLK